MHECLQSCTYQSGKRHQFPKSTVGFTMPLTRGERLPQVHLQRTISTGSASWCANTAGAAGTRDAAEKAGAQHSALCSANTQEGRALLVQQPSQRQAAVPQLAQPHTQALPGKRDCEGTKSKYHSVISCSKHIFVTDGSAQGRGRRRRALNIAIAFLHRPCPVARFSPRAFVSLAEVSQMSAGRLPLCPHVESPMASCIGAASCSSGDVPGTSIGAAMMLGPAPAARE